MSTASSVWSVARATSAANHHALAREPVRPDAADQEKSDQREEVCGEDDAHLRGVVGELRDVEGDGDDDHRVAHRARALAEPEVAKVVVAEDAEASLIGRTTT